MKLMKNMKEADLIKEKHFQFLHLISMHLSDMISVIFMFFM